MKMTSLLLPLLLASLSCCHRLRHRQVYQEMPEFKMKIDEYKNPIAFEQNQQIQHTSDHITRQSINNKDYQEDPEIGLVLPSPPPPPPARKENIDDSFVN